MKFFKNKRFKALIITKKGIILTICLLFLTFFLIFLAKKSSVPDTRLYTSAEEFHNMLLSSELNDEKKDNASIGGIIEKLLGFDITEPQTILYCHSPQFSEIRNTVDPAKAVYPQPTTAPAPTPAPQKKEYPIKEISAARGLSISNSTDKSVNTQELINSPLAFSIDSDKPQILIVHTHTTESYTDSGKTKYTASDNDRSTDETKNMIAVGTALAEVLNSRGIKTIHDTTVHDYPAYNGSYERSKATVLANLKKYPSIKIVLDVHRDGIVRSDGTKIKVACDIAGSKSAQCMFVVGSNCELTHDNWLENMKLACKIQNKANEMYPNFMRPINLRSERFNQQLSLGSLIIEVGSNGNTLNEAVYGAKLMGNVIAELFEK